MLSEKDTKYFKGLSKALVVAVIGTVLFVVGGAIYEFRTTKCGQEVSPSPSLTSVSTYTVYPRPIEPSFKILWNEKNAEFRVKDIFLGEIEAPPGLIKYPSEETYSEGEKVHALILGLEIKVTGKGCVTYDVRRFLKEWNDIVPPNNSSELIFLDTGNCEGKINSTYKDKQIIFVIKGDEKKFIIAIGGQYIQRKIGAPSVVERETMLYDISFLEDGSLSIRNSGAKSQKIWGKIQPSQAEDIIKERAEETLLAIENRDFERLSEFIHSDKGIRFSLNSYVHIQGDPRFSNLKKDIPVDLVFTSEQVRNFSSDNRKYLWGHGDGSGLEIIYTPKEYFQFFLGGKGYSANADEIGYNVLVCGGNMIKNVFEVYPEAIVVEYYFYGKDPAYEGMDWSALELVFEEKNGIWYLVGIIKDMWTI